MDTKTEKTVGPLLIQGIRAAILNSEFRGPLIGPISESDVCGLAFGNFMPAAWKMTRTLTLTTSRRHSDAALTSSWLMNIANQELTFLTTVAYLVHQNYCRNKLSHISTFNQIRHSSLKRWSSTFKDHFSLETFFISISNPKPKHLLPLLVKKEQEAQPSFSSLLSAAVYK